MYFYLSLTRSAMPFRCLLLFVRFPAEARKRFFPYESACSGLLSRPPADARHYNRDSFHYPTAKYHYPTAIFNFDTANAVLSGI